MIAKKVEPSGKGAEDLKGVGLPGNLSSLHMHNRCQPCRFMKNNLTY